MLSANIIVRYFITIVLNLFVFSLLILGFAVMSYGGSWLPRIIGIPIAIGVYIIGMRAIGRFIVGDRDPAHGTKINRISIITISLVILIWGVALYIGGQRSYQVNNQYQYLGSSGLSSATLQEQYALMQEQYAENTHDFLTIPNQDNIHTYRYYNKYPDPKLETLLKNAEYSFTITESYSPDADYDGCSGTSAAERGCYEIDTNYDITWCFYYACKVRNGEHLVSVEIGKIGRARAEIDDEIYKSFINSLVPTANVNLIIPGIAN